MRSKSFSVSVSTLLLYLCVTAVSASGVKPVPLPDPLTLEQALVLIDQQHPDLRLAGAALESARSGLAQSKAKDDLSVSLNATASWLEPSAVSPNQETEDHRLSLIVNKTLYDFGRYSSQLDAASQQVVSQDNQYLIARQNQYLVVMKRFFDVVLADLQFYRYNEEMAIAYIQYDRIQNRQKLGQYTEIDVAEKAVEYQRIRRLRTHSQNQQRVTRSLLAQALNRPDDLPSTVAKPEISAVSRKLPELEELQKQVNTNNPVLMAMKARLESAKSMVDYARSGSRPVLSAGIAAHSYTRETSSSDKWRATVTLDVPLWSGDRVDAAVAKAKSDVYSVEAELKRKELEIRQQLLELWLKIETLKIKHDEVVAGMEFSELALDKSRALYELEVTSDLGYSMVKFSEAERKVFQVKFEIALAWAQIDALTGNLLNKKKQ